jgi:hypothetical protein
MIVRIFLQRISKFGSKMSELVQEMCFGCSKVKNKFLGKSNQTLIQTLKLTKTIRYHEIMSDNKIERKIVQILLILLHLTPLFHKCSIEEPNLPYQIFP